MFSDDLVTWNLADLVPEIGPWVAVHHLPVAVNSIVASVVSVDPFSGYGTFPGYPSETADSVEVWTAPLP